MKFSVDLHFNIRYFYSIQKYKVALMIDVICNTTLVVLEIFLPST